ncbi:unnamed protein product [Vicia faba]|uniref:Uncharacterized protein n=1 Tax=Vicia faba TaxID=3906 RepID=A0AAV1A5M3_VICFA|nr:unnamed protein product [Vicia faba]
MTTGYKGIMNSHAKGNEKPLTKAVRGQAGYRYMTSHAKGSEKILKNRLRRKMDGVCDIPVQKAKGTCKRQAKGLTTYHVKGREYLQKFNLLQFDFSVQSHLPRHRLSDLPSRLRRSYSIHRLSTHPSDCFDLHLTLSAWFPIFLRCTNNISAENFGCSSSFDEIEEKTGEKRLDVKNEGERSREKVEDYKESLVVIFCDSSLKVKNDEDEDERRREILLKIVVIIPREWIMLEGCGQVLGSVIKNGRA